MKDSVTQQLSSLADQYPKLLGGIRNGARGWVRYRAGPRVRAVEAALDHLAGLICEDVCLQVPEYGGRFYLDARSALFRRLAREGTYEPGLAQLCRQYADPARDVLDIGANIGFHAVLFGKILQTGRVLSVEPTNNALARLQRNVAANEVSDRVIVHHGAVSDQPGNIEIKTIPGREEFSSAGKLDHPAIAGQAYNIETVTAITVDQLVQDYQLKPGFIKADVEGLEHLVFRGAGQVLAEHRPVILAELTDPLLRSNGSSASEVIEMIARHNYDIRDPLRPSVVPGTREFGDILCVPR